MGKYMHHWVLLPATLVEDKEGVGFKVRDDLGTDILPVRGRILSEFLQ